MDVAILAVQDSVSDVSVLWEPRAHNLSECSDLSRSKDDILVLYIECDAMCVWDRFWKGGQICGFAWPPQSRDAQHRQPPANHRKYVMILTLPPAHIRRFLGVEFHLVVAHIRSSAFGQPFFRTLSARSARNCHRASIKPRKTFMG